MPPESIGRVEFEGYVRRHESDQFAHAAMRHDLRNDIVGTVLNNASRIDALERWQQRIIGALAMLTFIVMAAAGSGVVILLKR